MPTATASRSISITLPPLHKGRDGRGQVEIDEHPARFKVIMCGRRWGKTTLGVRTCLKGALQTGGIYWWVGPSFPAIQASRAWPTLKLLSNQIPGVEIREADRCVIYPNGGEIWIKSSVDEDSLRGPGLYGVVMDEAASQKEDTWTDVLRPALTDHKGWAIFIGTPKGPNWFVRLWESARVKPGWASWKKPSSDNPFLDPEEIEMARLDMAENKFQQEYCADVGASSYLVFPEFDRNVHQWRGPVPIFDRYFGGLDFGGDSVGAHDSAGVVVGVTAQDQAIILRCFEQSGPNIGERQILWMLEMENLVGKLSKASTGRTKHILWRADKTQFWGIQQVRSKGINIFSSKGGKDSVTEGLELIHRRLKLRTDLYVDALRGSSAIGPQPPKPRLFYLPECHQIPAAFERYHNDEPDESKVVSSNPVKIKDDLMDATRYCIEGIDYAHYGDPMQLYKSPVAVIK